ncbi:MAG TPA: YfiR family protein [Casimicrobiaceae bacterium]|nr:YfiR family protein [Casimicrobiaceae bacterium]
MSRGGGNRSDRFARWSRAILLGLALLLSPAALPLAQGEAQLAAEYRVKAAFVYKFGEYIEWPSDAFTHSGNSIEIGVIGADMLADELERLVSARTINGRRVTVVKLRHGDPLDGVHVLFVGRSEESTLGKLLLAAKGRAIVTVTESDQALSMGSMINFVVDDDKVRFDIALIPVEQGNIRISARLLAVARKVMPKSS